MNMLTLLFNTREVNAQLIEDLPQDTNLDLVLRKPCGCLAIHVFASNN